jgi:methyl-accepting chemotaxis protein
MKTSDLATRSNGKRPARAALIHSGTPAKADKRKAPVNTLSRKQKIEERIAAASEELASGITEAAAAAE